MKEDGRSIPRWKKVEEVKEENRSTPGRQKNKSGRTGTIQKASPRTTFKRSKDLKNLDLKGQPTILELKNTTSSTLDLGDSSIQSIRTKRRPHDNTTLDVLLCENLAEVENITGKKAAQMSNEEYFGIKLKQTT